jgi:hypothetical protein
MLVTSESHLVDLHRATPFFERRILSHRRPQYSAKYGVHCQQPGNVSIVRVFDKAALSAETEFVEN